MRLHMTPELMEASYELLRAAPPFNRWKLPHPDTLMFRVTNSRDMWGGFNAWTNGDKEIFVSAFFVRSLDELNRTMAHEMVHLRQDMLGRRDSHGPFYQRHAALVCRRHGWDLATF